MATGLLAVTNARSVERSANDFVTETWKVTHTATTSGTDRTHEHFLIVPSSGTGDLGSISGSGGMAVDADGTHRVWFDYEL